MIKRQDWVLLHRWMGLVLAGFLVVISLTGSVLPFYRDLDKALSPELMRVDASAQRFMVDPLTLREQLLVRHPGLRADAVRLSAEPGDVLAFYVQPDPLSSSAHALPPDVDELYVDPTTGRELGGRMWGDLAQGSVNLMPFIYRLHYSLASGTVGTYVLGVVALLWTLDCFVAICLTFPVRLPRREGLLVRQGPGWWTRWLRAWTFRLGAGGYRLGFDVHRAGGLWLWALLFVFAWSAVSFNLSEVYRPIMGALFGAPTSAPTSMPQDRVLDDSTLDWRKAREQARGMMANLAAADKVIVKREESLSLDRRMHAWRYVVTSDRDLRDREGETSILFDVHSGELLSKHWPIGQSAGPTVTTWMTNLHMARMGGLPFRLFVSAVGLMVTALCVTGVMIWLRKQAGKRVSIRRSGGIPTSVYPETRWRPSSRATAFRFEGGMAVHRDSTSVP